jgi:uncharacterized protein (DUF1810 family)
MADPFDLDRFVQAQAPVMSDVLWELCEGRKRTHWMWFVFPQLRALGQSATAKHYGIASLDEARAYMAHPILGPRLGDCAGLVLAIQGRTAHDIFGSIDALKLRSCMTLFMAAVPDIAVFGDVIRKYYDGLPDERTMALLASG